MGEVLAECVPGACKQWSGVFLLVIHCVNTYNIPSRQTSLPGVVGTGFGPVEAPASLFRRFCAPGTWRRQRHFRKCHLPPPQHGQLCLADCHCVPSGSFISISSVGFRDGETYMDINLPRLAATEDSYGVVAHSEEDQVFALE